MEANNDIQIQAKEVPLFTVLKNGSILKNIFLLRKRSAVDKSSSYQESDEEVLLVGRHPHCNITLEHPSISRYHLRIHSNPSSHTLSVVDLSSVHGTWVSGKRIEPGVHVNLNDGDTVRIGGSSRIYELHWVPLSQAYDVDEQFVPTVYTIQEVEEETNQDEKLETQFLDDELGCPNLSLCNKIHDSPLKTLNPLISSAPNYFNYSCDDTVLVQAPRVVSETKSGTEISESLNNSEDELNWLRDNLSNEIEAQNDRIIKDNLFSVTNCSKSSWDDTEVVHSTPWKTDCENFELFTTVPVQAPLVVSEDISETEISGSLNSSEDELNWLRDNLSNELELQNDGIIEEQLYVPSCSKSSCDGTDSSPFKTGNGNDKFFLAVSNQSPPFVSISEIEISDSLKDQSNWVRDNLSNEFEQLCHGTMNDDDGVSMDLLDAIKMHIENAQNQNMSDDTLNKSEDQLNWLRDNLSNEFELHNDGIIKEEQLSVPSCSKSSCDDTDSSPCKTGNGNGIFFLTVSIQAPPLVSKSEIDISDSLNDQSNWVRDNLSNEFEQLCHGTMNDDDLVSMDLLDSIKMHKDVQDKIISDDNLNKSDQFNWLRDHLSNEQLSCGIMKDDLVSLDLFDAIQTHGKGALKNQYTTRSKEIDILMQKIDNVSVPVALLVDGVNRDEEQTFLSCKLKSIDHDIMKKESVFELLTDGIEMDQEQTFTPDIRKAHIDLESMKNVMSVSLNLFDSSDGNELEFYTPDKENKNPNACSGKSLLNRWKEDEHKYFTMSKRIVSPTEYEEKDISDFSKRLFTSVDQSNNGSITDGLMNTKTDKHDPFVCSEEVSLSSLEKDTESNEMKMEESCNSNYPQTIQKAVNSSHDVGKKRWTMVVDTDSLLHNESLKHLKLLEGLKGTQLFVPKTVIRELMDIKSQDNFLKRSTKKVSVALKWIADCMVNTRSWIHVDDEILHSSTAEPEVLKTALHLHKEITDRKVIILSNDLTLKIKAMAEGIICEAAEEFFRSLVNPFSERFMWVGSSARGPTWSFVDDDIMRQKYDAYGLNGSFKLKGLRLLAQY